MSNTSARRVRNEADDPGDPDGQQTFQTGVAPSDRTGRRLVIALRTNRCATLILLRVVLLWRLEAILLSDPDLLQVG